MAFPGGKRFALAILDDTDVATVENIRPVYDELERCGLRATKTVWMTRSPSRNFHRSQTMEDVGYADYVQALHRNGFEIAFHGASMESSRRDTTIRALEGFRSVFGRFPRIHANHAENRENLYWGYERFGSAVIRFVGRMIMRRAADGSDYFQGHVPGSQYFWGDMCTQHMDYVRNFCFDRLNQARLNPSQPYHDPRCPFVNFWFSGLDAPEVQTFNRLLSPANINRLESEGGVCIVATHFGKFFVREGQLDPATGAVLRDLATREGWYPTVSVLLDYLRDRSDRKPIGSRELRMLEWRWLAYRLRARRDLRPGWADAS